jgi:hypothetical protein
MLDILPYNFKDVIRARLAVDDAELSNDEIDNFMVAELAETTVEKRVPDYLSITSDNELLYLRSACVNFACYLLCPSMARRVNTSVSTFDVKWTKDKVDWFKLAQDFLSEYETSLSLITSVEITEIDYSGTTVNVITNTRNPIGGLSS